MADADNEETESAKPFYVDRAKSGRAGCKKCKQKINSGDLRIGKLGYNPFSSGTMKLWHHVPCMFEVFKKQRKTTKKIDSYSDIDGWESISDADRDTINSYFTDEEKKNLEAAAVAESTTCQKPPVVVENKDNTFRVFRKICSDITNASAYLQKTQILKDFLETGSDGKKFQGDKLLWVRLLLPMADKRIYNLQSKQLVKIFSDILRTDQSEMLEDLEKGDVAETVGTFFEQSKVVSPPKKSTLTIQEVNEFLIHLSKLTREADQIEHFKSTLPKCTTNDLKIIIRLIKHDLRINAGPKHILDALNANAYQAFQACRDLSVVVRDSSKAKNSEAGISVGITIMKPVLPMLAEACKSVEMALGKCPNGMYCEIKYDGERVQLHKLGTEFKYFSRSLKPVMPHKVRHFETYIPKAFPHGKDLILDCEILLMDTNTGQPLPFGTLGVHKKSEFRDATVCLFVFDCLYYNGVELMNEPIKKRRKILHENMTEIPNRVMFSEMKEIREKKDLEDMMERVFRQGLEGLVLKPLDSTYKPGKRHWLKVKKDYLFGGSMADSADLVVLGAWYGTGKKGGIMSVFLMGCYDEDRQKWRTVTKVHGGHDDETLEKLQKQLQMEKISRDVNRVPSWLRCSKTMIPDFVSVDPKKSQVWEIAGAEFTKNQVHTADGISIRFPRVTKIRHDKDWKTATNLSELKQLYEKSKDTTDFKLRRDPTPENSSPVRKKQKLNESPSTSKARERKNDDSSPRTDKIETETDVDTDDDETGRKNEPDKHESQKPKKDGDQTVGKKKPEKNSDSGSETEVDTEIDEDEKSGKKDRKSKQENSSPKNKHKKRSKDSPSSKKHHKRSREKDEKDSSDDTETEVDTDCDEKSNTSIPSNKDKFTKEGMQQKSDSPSSSKADKATIRYSKNTGSKTEDAERRKHTGNDSPRRRKDESRQRSLEDRERRKKGGNDSSERSKDRERRNETGNDSYQRRNDDSSKRSTEDRRRDGSSKRSEDRERRREYENDSYQRRNDESSKRSTEDRRRDETDRDSSRRKDESRKRSSEDRDRRTDNGNDSSQRRKDESSKRSSEDVDRRRQTGSDSSQRRKDELSKRSSEDADRRKQTESDSSQKRTEKSKQHSEEDSTQKRKDESSKRSHDNSSQKSPKRRRKSEDYHKSKDDSSATEEEVDPKKDKQTKKDSSGSDTEVEEDLAPSSGITMANPLPDIFKGDGFYLHPDIKDGGLMERYVMAYGGRIYCKQSMNTWVNNNVRVTHAIYPNKDTKIVSDNAVDRSAVHVTVDWLKNCIRKQKRIDVSDFRVSMRH